MKSRCSNANHPSFKHYGGRGITVSKQWKQSFAAFLSDVGRRPTTNHTLERINNNGDYESNNVRWATQIEQCQNTRRTRLVEYNGETLSISA